MIKIRRFESSGCVAIITGVCRSKVAIVLARRARIIVAGETSSGSDTGVIKIGCCPVRSIVAIFTQIASGQMGVGFACGWGVVCSTIMATEACAFGLGMIKKLPSGLPGNRRMTGAAIIRGLEVCRCFA